MGDGLSSAALLREAGSATSERTRPGDIAPGTCPGFGIDPVVGFYSGIPGAVPLLMGDGRSGAACADLDGLFGRDDGIGADVPTLA